MVWEVKRLEASQQEATEQLRLQIQAAQDSRLLLSSQVVERFFSEIERKCFDAADKLALSDERGRIRAYDLIHLSRKLRAHFEYYAENGRVWEDQLQEILNPPKTPKTGGMDGW